MRQGVRAAPYCGDVTSCHTTTYDNLMKTVEGGVDNDDIYYRMGELKQTTFERGRHGKARVEVRAGEGNQEHRPVSGSSRGR